VYNKLDSSYYELLCNYWKSTYASSDECEDESVCILDKWTSLLFILLFIKSQYTVLAHLICFALFILSIAHFTLYFSFFYLYICSCVVLLLYNFYFYSFALSTERTWFDLHFTSDYTLYHLLCDKWRNLEVNKHIQQA